MGWFKERLIWSDPAVVNDLTKSGLFVRIFAPQVSPQLLYVHQTIQVAPWSAQNLAGHRGPPPELSRCHQVVFLLLLYGCWQILARMPVACAGCVY